MRKTTNEEYSKLLKEHNPNLTLLSEFKGWAKMVLVSDLDTIVYDVNARSLLQNKAPSIRSALNKTVAFNIKMQKLFPDLHIEKEYTVGNKKMEVLDNLGIIYLVKPESILLGQYPSIESAIDKDKAFALKAGDIHGDLYDYSLVHYQSDKDIVSIVCKDHGIFYQRPNNHITQKQGCPLCNQTRGWSKPEWLKYSENKFCTLYKIRCWNETENFIKIGITSGSVNKRFTGKRSMPYNYEILQEIPGTGEEVWNLEQKLHKQFKQFKYMPEIKFHGRQECFQITIYNSLYAMHLPL